MDRRVTSPTWGLPPSCKQALIARQEQVQLTRSKKSACHKHFNFLNFERVAVLTSQFNVSDFKMWSLAVLTGDRIKERFSFTRKCMAVLPGRKKFP